MAGAKKTTGIQINHRKFYAQEQEWRPCKVSQKKLYSNGYKTFMSATSVQTGELYKNAEGKVVPWDNIEFTSTKPKEIS